MTTITGAQALSPELPAWWVRMLIGAGIMAYYEGDYEDAHLLNKSSLALSRMIGHKNLIRSSLNNLGMIAADQGEYVRLSGTLGMLKSIWAALTRRVHIWMSL